MVNLTFTSHNGVSFDLHDFTQAKLLKADFHSVAWSPEVINRQYGTTVNRFTKSAQTFDCTFRFKGDPAQRKAQIDAFIFEIENDMAELSPGRLNWNDQYIDVYFVSHDCYPVDSGIGWTELKGKYYAPFPFWIQEEFYRIEPGDPYPETIPKDVKGYPLDRDISYAYTYSYPYGVNTGVYYVDSPFGADFRAVIYGPISYFRMLADGNNYQINYPLRTGQKLVVDSRDILPLDEKCYVINENETTTNVYDYRDPTSSIFKKLNSGENVIYCDYPYRMDLTIFLERSAPI